MTQMNGVDLSRFEFDCDNTWAAFLTDWRLNVYSRFGGRDETASDARLDRDALLQTLREVLAVHERRAKGDLQSVEEAHPAPTPKTTPEDIPLLKASHQGCVHCHQVQEYRYLQAYHDRAFSRSLLFGFPLPENLGMTFDRDHGHRIAELQKENAAARAGLRPGDVVTRVNDVPVRSEQDVRWALHRAVETEPLAVVVEREGRAVRAELSLPPGWKQTELGWRKSLRSVPLALGFLGYELGREERRSARIPEKQLALRVISLRGPGLQKPLGLQKDDLIVALGGEEKKRSFDEFKSDLLRRFDPGDEVRLTVLRQGQRVELKGAFPDWYTEDNSVP